MKELQGLRILLKVDANLENPISTWRSWFSSVEEINAGTINTPATLSTVNLFANRYFPILHHISLGYINRLAWVSSELPLKIVIYVKVFGRKPRGI